VSAVLASRPDLVWGARSLVLDRLRIPSSGDTERVAS